VDEILLSDAQDLCASWEVIPPVSVMLARALGAGVPVAAGAPAAKMSMRELAAKFGGRAATGAEHG